MAEYKDEKICDLISKLENEEILLPAMQRDFVWPIDKICDLFESILRDYPIGTFLFWDVDIITFERYTFNKFLSDVHERRKGDLVRGERSRANKEHYTAVLDGQQRITSIYLGICGCYRRHIKSRPWADPMDTSSFEKLFLCVNVLHVPLNEDDKYQFDFLPEEKINKNTNNSETQEHEFWIKVSEIYETCNKEGFDVVEFQEEKEVAACSDESITWNATERKNFRNLIGKFKEAFFIRPVLNYYSAKDMELGQVVEIFVRVNSGGQKLTASDLMLSVASAAHSDTMGEDFHVKIQNAIEQVNNATTNPEGGFMADQDTILTTGLMIIGAQKLSLNKEENYEVATLNKMISKWDSIVDSLCAAVKYYEKLGFESRKLSKNYVMSVAYYFYLHNLTEDHFEKQNDRANCDRILIRQWTLRSMINGLFNYGTRNILAKIREYIESAENQEYFPLDRLFNLTTSVSLSISKEQIVDDILTLRYGDVRIDPLLRELSRNDSGAKLTVDHIWAQDLMKNKKTIKKNYRGISEEDLKKFASYAQLLPNLQLLTVNENSNKGNKFFKEWDENQHNDHHQRTAYYTMNYIPIGISFNYENFIEFFEKRRELLKDAIEEALPPTFEDIVAKYSLPVHS